MDIFSLRSLFAPFILQIYRPILMLPNIVFQIPQPSLIVIYQSLNIFPLWEGHQIAVPGLMKTDDSRKPCHLGHFQQGVVVILGGTDI